jgi:diguanylate cyclase
MLTAFFNNMTLIISIVFIGVRIKKFILRKTDNNLFFRRLLPLIAGLMSAVVMMIPFRHQGMIFDLRSLPVFILAYSLGWKQGLISAVIPTVYRLYLGGETAWPGVVLAILFPVLLGGLFYEKDKVTTLLVEFELKRVLVVYLLFSLLKSGIQFFVMDITAGLWLKINLVVTGLSLFSLTVMVMLIKDVNQSLIDRKELEYKANYDGMTTLANLEYFKNKVKNLLAQGTAVVIIMIDIDYFKMFNDTHGHPAGNEVLKELAQVLKENIRGRDLIARYGGEEFILAVSSLSDKEEVFFLARRLRKKVEDYQFEGEETLPGGQLTVSFGISSLSESKSLEELIEEADEALYESKEQGRNKISFH